MQHYIRGDSTDNQALYIQRKKNAKEQYSQMVALAPNAFPERKCTNNELIRRRRRRDGATLLSSKGKVAPRWKGGKGAGRQRTTRWVYGTGAGQPCPPLICFTSALPTMPPRPHTLATLQLPCIYFGYALIYWKNSEINLLSLNIFLKKNKSIHLLHFNKLIFSHL